MAATKRSATLTTPMRFKNKHRLNEKVFPPPCPLYIPDIYISVSNKPTPSTDLTSPSGLKIAPAKVVVGNYRGGRGRRRFE